MRAAVVLLTAAWCAQAAVQAQTAALPSAPAPTTNRVNDAPAFRAERERLGAPVQLEPLRAKEAMKATKQPDAPLDSFAGRAGSGGPMDASLLQPSMGAQIDLTAMFRAMGRAADRAETDGGSGADSRYHWKPMLWQSLAFIGTENTWRLLTDANMRRLIAGKPYWHDYFASLGQWNMGRWWDGDSILVDDIGHPMQGGVSSFIEIQNSPRQRALRFGMNKEYWRSRMLGMLWATVFSTQQKIGPLGEAALGSDGGITYPLNCPFPCSNYTPGVTKYTNNTGWTDFIMTPVVGTVWVMGEDWIDLKISDRIQDAHPNAWWPKVIRGALNPTRTMANAMRWRKPWYRDFQDNLGDPHMTRFPHLEPGDEEAARTAPRFEVFPHYDAIWLPVNTASCTNCRQATGGYGVGFAARLTKWIDFDSDVNYFANASPLPSDRAGGNATLATFGFRSGVTYAHFSVKASVRPGFLSYDRAYETIAVSWEPTPNLGRITHFATALAVNADYGLTRRVALRLVVGNTGVRYRTDHVTAPGVGKPPYLNWLSHDNFLTNENWMIATGAVLRF
ncbi:MAG TPA: hypothetical protein VGR64_03115 [Terracidiphilus sp.]|nr:hypothetical protein [Terracidiphilus sp.]